MRNVHNGLEEHPGIRIVNKELWGIDNMGNDFDLAPTTRKVLNDAERELCKQREAALYR